MSVLVEGMELPKCHFKTSESYGVNGFLMVYPNGKAEIHIMVGGGEYWTCEVIGLPPHGGLIDVDRKTFPTPHRNPSNDYMHGWNACLRSVQQQPVIIEADWGDDQ